MWIVFLCIAIFDSPKAFQIRVNVASYDCFTETDEEGATQQKRVWHHFGKNAGLKVQ